MRVRANLDLCRGHGVCVQQLPEVFDLDKQQARVVVRVAHPAEGQRSALEKAVSRCPTFALSIDD